MQSPNFDALQAAAQWFAVLSADHVDSDDLQRWQLWMNASAQHRDAWRQVEAISQRLQSMPGGIAARTALRMPGKPRRAFLRNTSLALFGLVVGWQVWRQPDVQRYAAAWGAKHRTGVGSTKLAELADGSRLWLNTDSAADDYYTEDLRLIQLHAGEIMVHTAPDLPRYQRPFVVDAVHGRMRALGTKFMVRLHDNWSELSVFEGAVEVTTPFGKTRVIAAGEHARVQADGVTQLSPSSEHATSWVNGVLTADGMRLDNFLNELGRYRHGYLGCVPEVAHLRLTGIYPLADTDKVLQAVEESLPVHVSRPLPWWVTVGAR